jgi:hypothetical protein
MIRDFEHAFATAQRTAEAGDRNAASNEVLAALQYARNEWLILRHTELVAQADPGVRQQQGALDSVLATAEAELSELQAAIDELGTKWFHVGREDFPASHVEPPDTVPPLQRWERERSISALHGVLEVGVALFRHYSQGQYDTARISATVVALAQRAGGNGAGEE